MPKDNSLKHGQPSYNYVRVAKRASYDRKAAYEVLDSALIGQVGFVVDDRPMVIPMAFGRIGDCVYLHGASKTRAMRLVGQKLCFNVTHLDGLVAARSGMHHSANYRSVVVHGTARSVTDPDEFDLALTRITEHLLPGRMAEIRPMTPQERKATAVIALGMEAVSLKSRSGPPNDDATDHDLGLWGGVVPVVTALGRGVSDAYTPDGLGEPTSIAAARAKFAH